jgi:hypothetical protein
MLDKVVLGEIKPFSGNLRRRLILPVDMTTMNNKIGAPFFKG